MLYPTFWAHRTAVKTATNFSPYQLVHGVESVLPVECEIPSLKLSIEIFPDTSALEECLVHLEQFDEQCRDALVALEVNKCCVKVQYDKSVHLRKFSEGDLVLLWDQAKEPLGARKFNPMWHGPYVVKCVLKNTMHDLQPRLIIVYYCIDFCIVRFSYGDRVC